MLSVETQEYLMNIFVSTKAPDTQGSVDPRTPRLEVVISCLNTATGGAVHLRLTLYLVGTRCAHYDHPLIHHGLAAFPSPNRSCRDSLCRLLVLESN